MPKETVPPFASQKLRVYFFYCLGQNTQEKQLRQELTFSSQSHDGVIGFY